MSDVYSPSELYQQAMEHHQAGNSNKAQQLCQELLQQTPDYAPALFLLALIASTSRRFPDAVKLFQKAISLEPENPSYYKGLADVYVSQGNNSDAIACYKQALELNRDYFEVHANLGNVLINAKQVDEALGHYKEAVKLRPDIPQLHDNLGNVLRISGQPELALASHKEALRLNPKLFSALINMGCDLEDLGEIEAAIDVYKQALSVNPKLVTVHANLGSIFLDMKRMDEALYHYQEAVKLRPDIAQFHDNLGIAFSNSGNPDSALDCHKKALQLDPDIPEVHYNLANALCDKANFKLALTHYREAIRLQPGFIEAVCGEFHALMKQGDQDSALKCIEPHATLRSKRSEIAVAFSHLAQNKEQRSRSIDELKCMLEQGSASVDELRKIHFRLGHLCDAVALFDEAFEHYQQGNVLKGQSYDRAAYRHYIDRIISTINSSSFSELPQADNTSELPVFIVGMPRVGKTLIEQILSSHPQITGAGELPDIEQISRYIEKQTGKQYPLSLECVSESQLSALAAEYLAKRQQEMLPGSLRVVDTMPRNIHYLGLIFKLFPKARVIHCLRDPVDTCLECYFKDFRWLYQYAYDLEDLGSRYSNYRSLAKHWQNTGLPVLELHYEDLVKKPEETSRNLVSYLGLEWDPQCLQFHISGNPRTMHNQEFFEPINSHAVGRWHNYRQHLQPLLGVLKGLVEIDGKS